MTREEAIRKLQKHKNEYLDEWVDYSGIVEALDMAIEALPAEAVQGWIPCSERLPSDGGNYLITVADLRLGHIGEHTVTMADFYAKEKKWNSAVDVYAWMPLPEPYKGGEK